MATDKTDFKDVNRGKFHVVNPRTGKAMALNSSKEDAKKKARKMTRDENKPFVVVQTVGMVVPEKQK